MTASLDFAHQHFPPAVVPGKRFDERHYKTFCVCHPDQNHPSADVDYDAKAGMTLIICRTCGANGAAMCEARSLPVGNLYDTPRTAVPRTGYTLADYVVDKA